MRRSLGYLVCIVVGTTIVLVAVAAGITGALLAVPALRPLLLAGAALYIARLAYAIATAPPLGAAGASGDAPTLGGGTLLGVANPKAWVAIGAVFAAARLADGAASDALLKVAVLSVMVVVINGSWLLVGTSFAPLLREPRRARIVNVALAVALVAATAAAIVH